MSARVALASLTRIARLEDVDFAVKPIPRSQWGPADYVLGEVDGFPGRSSLLELSTGRMVELVDGDRVIGAFGERRATLEAVGDWRSIRDDRRMHALTGAGLFGRCTSRSGQLAPLIELRYTGHIHVQGRKVGMYEYVEEIPERPLEIPVVLIVGTSMSAGKTTSARIIVRQLVEQGRKVCGTKLTGAGRFRDILAMADSGAADIFDFVDVGLPSTVCSAGDYRIALRQLLSRIQATAADVVVAEVGASPLEPYNGGTAIRELRDNVRCTVLCASDPYAVLGVMEAHGIRPDLIGGLATSTSAGIELVEKLVGVRALDLLDPDALPALTDLLNRRLAPHLDG